MQIANDCVDHNTNARTWARAWAMAICTEPEIYGYGLKYST